MKMYNFTAIMLAVFFFGCCSSAYAYKKVDTSGKSWEKVIVVIPEVVFTGTFLSAES